ncbi:BON domain-containing protein [Paraburkholderia dinghuensis]|uniref:BON domain-containing protein n=1 Tax=Paraburkholderia dinghuensis TaxID=2305225 RepID=A0A3N6MRG0_9BURK|nr:BON domain-containing protein [Paraburkholderia dinghuensis]RQH06544.1 BON domain-containing protein [Paraburkholderia dinghuensis]
MKAIQVFKLAAATALVAASFQVYAQGDAASAAPAASGPTAAAQHQVNQSQAQLKQAKAANRALSRKVRGVLAKDKTIDVAKITVRARDGAVELQGSVPEQAQIEHATEVAKGVQGVTSVKNSLTIRPNQS